MAGLGMVSTLLYTAASTRLARESEGSQMHCIVADLELLQPPCAWPSSIEEDLRQWLEGLWHMTGNQDYLLELEASQVAQEVQRLGAQPLALLHVWGQTVETVNKQGPQLHAQVIWPRLCPAQKQWTIILLSGAAAYFHAALPHLSVHATLGAGATSSHVVSHACDWQRLCCS